MTKAKWAGLVGAFLLPFVVAFVATLGGPAGCTGAKCYIAERVGEVIGPAVANVADCAKVEQLQKDLTRLLGGDVCAKSVLEKAKTGPISAAVCPILVPLIAEKGQEFLKASDFAKRYECKFDKATEWAKNFGTAACMALPF